jgi:hypothetical protein
MMGVVFIKVISDEAADRMSYSNDFGATEKGH